MMTALATVPRVLVRLFVDDGSLALAIIAVIALAAGTAALGRPTIAGVVLLGGCLTVLFGNVMRTVRKRGAPRGERS